ncbi:hypothetical protein BX616_003014 [Lobosporangium transversale]|uniref:SigF-like NTF2-like domain-containing protein n=1 Tax=Lobosporangium transversale TaxID=64571 RepID=A0A1Y2GHA4_9FUNG|nr:hypothetical protein BCR41DRAFT_388881 [Lobosporangium transversale]KAF9899478.1 hypothetical protein BX616_003014 [Lobosporangium transversale]ORZ07513.1 hypothetical protein BCR41DRAFT_388881 [Lobosporangium transversale]|eukprot:XP_021878020.1 hypothetical protein BCR41DRAFT_388881 [Lobosporangium transversale]
MEDPASEIPSVIYMLTTGTPSEQKHTLETYFTPDSSFQHPFCRVSSFSDISIPLLGVINSRWVMWMIYRWYKFLSPKIAIEVHSVVQDLKKRVLYVEISQVFSLWFVPLYKSHVHFVAALHLTQFPDDKRYYIFKQEDHYQFNEFVKFVWPGGDTFLTIWQFTATLACIIGGLLLAPLTFWTWRRE